MLSVERKFKIAEVVGKNGGVKTSDLSNMFSVSEMTILRDLEMLEQQGILKRVYGGAVNLKSPIKELSVILRKQINAKEKNIIAEKAAKLISNGESIFLDSSTTAFALSKKLGPKTGLTVITNGLELINELKNNSNINLFCPGGELQLSTMSFVGTSAEEYLKEYYVDKAFVSASGVSLQSGITVENAVQAAIKKIMFKNSLSRVILVDSSKFDVVRLSKVCTLEDINTIVTDRKPDSKFLDAFKKNNIEVVY
jgi:DeoR/GlpR family transcriptional regulator of sugar metabolism